MLTWFLNVTSINAPKNQNKRRQLLKMVSFGLTEDMKFLGGLESRVSKKRLVMKVQPRLYTEQWGCVSGISALSLDLWLACAMYFIYTFFFLLQFHFYRLSYTIYELIFILNPLANSLQYLRNCQFENLA